MKSVLFPAAAIVLAGAGLPAPAAAETAPRTVTVSIDPRFCPDLGVYGISYVAVQGTGDLRAGRNFIWNTQAAEVSIDAVPPEGAIAYITVTYRCKVRMLWWQEAGRSRYVTAARWVHGTGPQQSYTLAPPAPEIFGP